MSNKKRITIIGRGTAGVLSTAYFLKNTDWDIVWAYDSSKDPLSVGEGTNLGVPYHLYQSLNFTHADLIAANGTVKQGVYKKNWGDGSDFLHPFPSNLAGMHFSATELREQVIDKLSSSQRITMIDEEVTDPSSLDSDYVMVCSGWPKDLENQKQYELAAHVPVNAAYVVQCYWDHPRFSYTISNAQKYGWLFAIPLQNRVSVGYLYDETINTIDEVKEDLLSLIAEMNLQPSEQINQISFKSFYNKNNFSSKVVYNGNASFFLEPLEATSLGFSDRINRIALKLWMGIINEKQAQEYYESEMNVINSFLSMHYMAGSIFDTPFWQKAKTLGFDRVQKDISNNTLFAKQLHKALLDPYSQTMFQEPTWIPWSYYINAVGLQIENKLKQLFQGGDYYESY